MMKAAAYFLSEVLAIKRLIAERDSNRTEASALRLKQYRAAKGKGR